MSSGRDMIAAIEYSHALLGSSLNVSVDFGFSMLCDYRQSGVERA
jgi:hypothetical protein